MLPRGAGRRAPVTARRVLGLIARRCSMQCGYLAAQILLFRDDLHKFTPAGQRLRVDLLHAARRPPRARAARAAARRWRCLGCIAARGLTSYWLIGGAGPGSLLVRGRRARGRRRVHPALAVAVTARTSTRLVWFGRARRRRRRGRSSSSPTCSCTFARCTARRRSRAAAPHAPDRRSRSPRSSVALAAAAVAVHLFRRTAEMDASLSRDAGATARRPRSRDPLPGRSSG